MEDYAWGLAMLKQGWACRRVGVPLRYLRRGHDRTRFFAAMTFRFARRDGLRVHWDGVVRSLLYASHAALCLLIPRRREKGRADLSTHGANLLGLATSFWPPSHE